MAETWKAARVRLHRELGEQGWEVSRPDLKVLWARPRSYASRGAMKLSFQKQAIHLGVHSMFLDIRGMSVETLIAEYIRRGGY